VRTGSLAVAGSLSGGAGLHGYDGDSVKVTGAGAVLEASAYPKAKRCDPWQGGAASSLAQPGRRDAVAPHHDVLYM
jgi:hypothetical protein